jgi:hypothetical protein
MSQVFLYLWHQSSGGFAVSEAASRNRRCSLRDLDTLLHLDGLGRSLA